MPTPAEVLVLLAAVLGSGSLVGVGVWLYFRTRRLAADTENLAQLEHKIDRITEGLTTVQDQVAELHERVDFTERVLTEGREKGRQLPGP